MKNQLQPFRWLLDQVRVNIPFRMLYDTHLKTFLENRIHPEIGIDAKALDRFSESEFAAVAKNLEAQGLSPTFHGPFMDLAPASPDAAVRDLSRRRLEQVLPLIPVFKAVKVVCHAGYDWKRYGFMRDAWLTGSIDFWCDYGSAVREAGSGLVLENVYEHHPDDLRPLFEALKSVPVGFCLDAGHQSAFGRAPLEAWLDVLGGHVSHLHLHDNDGSADQHLAMGRGRVDFKRIFSRLPQDPEKRPSVTLEPHAGADLRPSLEYLAAVWPWGKSGKPLTV